MPIHTLVYLCFSSCTDGIFDSTATPVGHAFPFVQKSTHPTSTALLYPRGGTVGERSQFYATSITRKRGASNGSMICPMPELTLTTGRCESVCIPCSAWAQRTGSSPTFLFRPQSRTRSRHRTPSSTTPHQNKRSSWGTWTRTPAELIPTCVDLTLPPTHP
jgi:hypothetical protein